ncbi:MAG TPA: glycosyltransferase family 4 protein [Flavisolibacter sp.]|nr:glycosyltransferase family 4 protein [Flavisolibacter sp.]
MNRNRHIVIVCSRLDLPGGIERAVVSTAHLLSQTYQVTLLILDQVSNSFYSIDSSVSVVHEDLTFGIQIPGNFLSRKWKLIQDIRRLRNIIRLIRPDFIIGSEMVFSVSLVLAGARKYSKVLAWEHHHFLWLKPGSFWKALRSITYPRLNGIVCLNQREADLYRRLGKTDVIPNFIYSKTTHSTLSNKELLSIGWFIPRKGIDLLLAAAGIVLKQYPDWKWRLIGKGEMEEQVRDFTEKEDLGNQLLVEAPQSEDLDHQYVGSSLFVLSSRSEAFPMVLLEALSFGVPCISFDCESGPSDIITHGEDGILVPKENVPALADAIIQLIKEEEERKKMGEKALENIKRFSPEVILKKWQVLLNEL